MSAAAFKSHGRGRLVLKGTFGGIKVERSSGTNDPKMLDRLKEMLRTIAESGGRLDLVRGVAEGLYKPLALWEHYRTGNWDALPSPDHVRDLKPILEAWRDRQKNKFTKKAARGYVANILAYAPAHAKLAALPQAISDYREVCRGPGIAQMFNKTRSAAMSAVRTLPGHGRNSPLWNTLSRIEPLKVTKKRIGHPQRPAQAWAIAQTLGGEMGRIWWTLCCTGMGPDEYFEGKWSVQDGRLFINGTKRESRPRLIPLLVTPQPATMVADTFEKKLRKSGLGVTPYDGRRSFDNWLVEAGFHKPRRKMYLGHAPADSTELYDQPQIEQWIDEDEAALKTLLGGIGGTPTPDAPENPVIPVHFPPRATEPKSANIKE